MAEQVSVAEMFEQALKDRGLVPRPKYGTIRGRHRHYAAIVAGEKTVRCDDHVPGAPTPTFRRIPVEELIPDPSCQFDWSFNKKKAMDIARTWTQRDAGVLDVSLLEGGLTPEERNALKVKKDKDRRTVRHVETFLNRVQAGDPNSKAIFDVVVKAGFEIGRDRPGQVKIEATKTLENIYAAGGEELLRRTLVINATWKGEPKTNTADWLAGLARFCSYDYDRDLSESQYEKLQNIVPAKVVRWAQGEAEGSYGSAGASQLHTPTVKLIAEKLRTTIRRRKSPALRLVAAS